MSSVCPGVMGGDTCQPVAALGSDWVESGGPRVRVRSCSSHAMSRAPQICDFRACVTRSPGWGRLSDHVRGIPGDPTHPLHTRDFGSA